MQRHLLTQNVNPKVHKKKSTQYHNALASKTPAWAKSQLRPKVRSGFWLQAGVGGSLKARQEPHELREQTDKCGDNGLKADFRQRDPGYIVQSLLAMAPAQDPAFGGNIRMISINGTYKNPPHSCLHNLSFRKKKYICSHSFSLHLSVIVNLLFWCCNVLNGGMKERATTYEAEHHVVDNHRMFNCQVSG